jgi:prepilin-type N-terminal cleavage/methylation domain-containing protein
MKIKPALIKNKDGLSMLEIIVAISIISIVFFGLMNIYPVGVSITGSAEEKTVAGFLAQEKIESLRSQKYKNIEPGTVETKHRLSSDENNYRYNYWRETQVENMDENLSKTASSTGLKKVTSVVYYTDSLTKKEKSYRVATLISE